MGSAGRHHGPGQLQAWATRVRTGCPLRVVPKYGGALSTDDEQQAQAVSRFITDALAARLDR